MAVVLVVEDEAAILILAESVLEHAGFKTLSAGSLAQASAIIELDQDLDLAFTDLNLMSDIEGGIKVSQLLFEKRPGTPVLYTSGMTITDGMKELFVEPSEFLAKPYRDEELVQAIVRLLRNTGHAK